MRPCARSGTALLEADVALPVVRQFIDGVRPKAIGADVIRSVTPGQMVIKIVNDHLVEMLGGTVADLELDAIPPVVILMVGLQGSGKTDFQRQDRLSPQPGPARHGGRDVGGSLSVKRKVMMASLDTRRPAAQQQLKILGEQTGVADAADRAAGNAAGDHARARSSRPAAKASTS